MADPETRGALVHLVFGTMAAQAVRAAVRLGVPNALAGRERTAPEVAADCATDPDATRRLLRALAALDLLTETGPDTFALTPAGALLRSDQPGSLHAFAEMFTDETITGAWQRLDHAVRTGNTTFADVFGTDFFAHLKSRPELSATFNASMSQGTALVAETLPARYPFERFHTVADIGGGDGTLLAAILRAHPHLRGILYDTEEGQAEAGATLGPVADRVDRATGDFFTGVPAGADVYLLKSVIHDWPDDACATILDHCRRVVPADGRLLIVEPILPDVVDEAAPPVMYLSDLNMLVNLGGRERTRADFDALCRRCGFALTDVVDLPPAAFRIIEATPVQQ
ncbi:methyltransferase [Actinophytocola gossypii]|uniref:Methyltransferase n=1 Tax=Actinophytocola gossypii TaxID=2812003 RepID=A0ABT2J3M4_9PSEU|nr:methyltransferase [Actinophytocola gossypii]MCT2582115.1 methyltransferase [Actinophytocola gossypii]